MRIIQVEDIAIEVTYKRVKNLNLRVYPGEERVAVSCPPTLSENTLKSYLKSKAPWIKNKLSQPVQKKPDFAAKDLKSGDTVTLWGNSYTLQITTGNSTENRIFVDGENLFICHKSDKKTHPNHRILIDWYRKLIKAEVARLISKWEPVMAVQVNDFGVKRMKTRWGTCNITAGRIWLNLLLIEKPIECLELVVVHEMTHLLERLHTPRFYRLMSSFLPDWKEREELLEG